MSNAPKKQFKMPKLATPRAMQEIETEHGNLCARLGLLEYTVAVYQEDAKTLKEQLKSLNHEAAARKELDAKAVGNESSSTAEVVNS